MKNNTRDRAKGAARELKGKVQRKAGKALGNRGMEDRGETERIAGKTQRKIGEVEKFVED